MTTHPYDPNCNCDPCFVVWRAEAVAEGAAAHERGEQRREQRELLWAEMIDHFESLLEDR